MVNSEFKDFTTKANQVDQVFAAAAQRRAQREQPQDAWKYVDSGSAVMLVLEEK